MTRVLVFEYLCAGGAAELDAAQAAELLPQGRAMRDAMLADLLGAPPAQGLRVSVATGAPGDSLPLGAQTCPLPARPQGHTLPQWLGLLAQQHDVVWAVAPETDGLLAACQAAVPAGRWLGCDAPAIALASRKRATLARLAARGLKTPLAFSGQAVRWVTKPDDGAGATSTQVHGQLADAHAATCRGVPGMTTLEPWVEGEPLSLSLLCSPGRQPELLAVNRQQIALDDAGWVHYRGVEIDVLPRQDARWPTLGLLASRVGEALPGLRGWVGVDLVWHAGEGPVLIEVNPRLTGAYAGLSARLQRNLAAEMLAHWQQEAARDAARAA